MASREPELAIQTPNPAQNALLIVLTMVAFRQWLGKLIPVRTIPRGFP
jgi:hypothetical protein